MLESACFRIPFPSPSVRGSQTLLKSARQHFYPNFPLNQEKLCYKTSPLVRIERLRLFGNTLAAGHMYSSHIWEKFLQEVKTRLSQNQKTLSGIFIGFLQSTQNFAYFEKEDWLHSLNISEVI